MNIENLMQGITNQNLVQAEMIKLRAENDQLKARIKYLEANQYSADEYVPIKLAVAALDAQENNFKAELAKLAEKLKTEERENV